MPVITETTEWQLPDGSYAWVSETYIEDPTSPYADQDGRVYISRSNQNIDLTGATQLPAGTIEAWEAQAIADYEAASAQSSIDAQAERQAQFDEANAQLEAAGLPQAAIDALLALYGGVYQPSGGGNGNNGNGNGNGNN